MDSKVLKSDQRNRMPWKVKGKKKQIGERKSMNINVKKRLYRSRKNRRVAGVCSGIADFLAVDPTIVRILWVLLAMAGGPGVLLYIIMAAIVPEEPEFIQTTAQKIKNDDYI